MEQQFLESAKREIINGYAKRRHPFRYFWLATLSNGSVRQRTVVLRKLVDDFSLLVYTDARSQKVKDIQQDPRVSAIFYHPKKLLQLQFQATTELITEPNELKGYWGNIPEASRRDYTTSASPGTPISNLDAVSYNEDQPNFCIIKLVPHTIEYLELRRPNHLRILFQKKENDWKGQFLVP